MRRRPRWNRTTVALLIGATYLVLAAVLTPDFGPTWDVVMGEYPYGNEVVAWWQSDEPDFVTIAKADAPPDMRQPYPAFHRLQFPWYEIYPLAGTISAFSARIFWHHLGWVPAVPAHQFVVPLFTAMLLVCLVRTLGSAAGAAASVLLIASPRFLCHSIGNLKDVPECVLYVLTLLASYRALRTRRIGPWMLTGALTALALAQKANALFLPWHVLGFLVGARLVGQRRFAIHWRGIGLGTVAFVVIYLAVSPAFWHDTLARIEEHFGQVMKISSSSTALHAQLGIEASAEGSHLHSAFIALATTPLPVTGLALLGVLRGPAPKSCRWFLAWAAVFPLLRIFVLGIRDFDGVRHFLEFYPPLCALAGLGLVWAWRAGGAAAARWTPIATAFARAGIVAVAVLPGSIAVIHSYPFGTCWFNALVGGLAGAQARGIPDATDYWAQSYWQGMAWLNEHATQGAAVLAPIAPQVLDSLAPVALRPDLVPHPDDLDAHGGDAYVMYVTRETFYGQMIRGLEAAHQPVHQITVQGAPILKIHRFSTPTARTELLRLVAAERRLAVLMHGLLAWIKADRTVGEGLQRAVEAGRRSAAEGIDALLRLHPALSREDAAALLARLLRGPG